MTLVEDQHFPKVRPCLSVFLSAAALGRTDGETQFPDVDCPDLSVFYLCGFFSPIFGGFSRKKNMNILVRISCGHS